VLLQTIGQIPFNATVPPSMIQTAYRDWSGQPAMPSADATTAIWKYNTADAVINPGVVTNIGSDISKLSTVPPWA
jgi:hypothetical protein